MATAPNVSAVGTIGLTVAGGYFFGPAGAAAGAVLGSFLFGASGPDIEGPRLGDTSVAASTYGNDIPVAFGVQKLAGAMIWATDIIEDKNTRKEGDGIFVHFEPKHPGGRGAHFVQIQGRNATVMERASDAPKAMAAGA